MPSTQDLVARSIRLHLAALNQTMTWLAEEVGESQFWISRRMTGRIAFDLNDMDRISAVFGISVERLIADGDALSSAATPDKQAS